MKKTFTLILVSILFNSLLISQNNSDRAIILKKTNVERLKEIANENTSNNQKFANSKIDHQIILANGELGHLCGFDKNGNPTYTINCNEDAAISSQIHSLWSGGISGLNLDGSGIEIGLWESGGYPLLNHQEFNNNISKNDVSQFFDTDHATHVAGTIVGNGTMEDSKGMASGASIKAYETFDRASEAALFAANGGILSSHSYLFNDFHTNIFGAYSSQSQQWDELVFNAPYFLVNQASGNFRDDSYNVQDYGYDLVVHKGTAKNVLTVGAVDDVDLFCIPSEIKLATFSSQGPTDDWRIKPDLVANGVELFSASNESQSFYSFNSGTSMSTPVVTGAVALLQQHYHNLFEAYMQASTVKGLLICTTDEAGEFDGPDFQAGWGLLNAERAAEVISKNGETSLIQELSITNGNELIMQIEVDGQNPLALTIAWTDPPGIENGNQEDETDLKLVNDLDMRVLKNGVEYFPWVMTPNNNSNNFDDPPTKGDNFRDNVERIDIPNLEAGEYEIVINHKGQLLYGSQDFSLIINGLKPLEVVPVIGDAQIYPIPVTEGFFNINFPEIASCESFQIQIYDALGKIIYEGNHMHEKIEIGKKFSPGMYLVSIKSDKFETIKKIIIN